LQRAHSEASTHIIPSYLKDINLNTTLKYPDFLWASRVKSGIWHMFSISKTRADRGKPVLFLESAGQIYPETGLTFEAPKCVLASVIREKKYITGLKNYFNCS